MTSVVLPRENPPELKSGWGHPWWHHHHSMKMRHEKTEPGPIVYIAGSAAFTEIHPCEGEQYVWNVKWRVQFSRDEEASGNCVFTTEQLECAFGLRDAFSNDRDIEHSNWMLKEYGGSVAFQGRFIRWRDYLTIPAPGMGHDGVAAVSIELDDGIKKAVREAIAQRFPGHAS